jgi:hypothetical protein
MPVTNSSEYGVDTRTISSKAVTATASIALHPAEDGYHARIHIGMTGGKGQNAIDFQQVLGVTGQATAHHARSSQSSYEVPSSETGKMLEKLGLPKDLGGKTGVTIKFSYDTANHGTSAITIEAKDPKLAAFSPEHAGKIEATLATTKGALPDALKSEVVKAHPHLAAHIELQPRTMAGTRINFSPVEAGNLQFSMRHNAKTGLDEIVLPASNDPKQMQAMHERVTEHLKAKGVVPAGSNFDEVHRTATTHATNPAPSETHIRTGGLTISLPKGSGERALTALSQSAEFKVGNNTIYSSPIVAPEIAKAAAPEMEATVRKVAVAEHEAHVASQKLGGRPANFGNILTKLGVATVMATGAGLAAAAQAPEGQRLETGAKAAGKALAEGALPGVTETDTCKKVGAVAANIGSVVAGGVTFVAATAGTVALAVPTGGGSVAVSPVTVVAATGIASILGDKVGSALGEAGCNLVRDAVNALSADNKAQIAHKPTAQTVASAKTPDAIGAKPSAGHTQGRS